MHDNIYRVLRTDRQAGIQTVRQAGRQAGRQTDRQADRDSENERAFSFNCICAKLKRQWVYELNHCV